MGVTGLEERDVSGPKAVERSEMWERFGSSTFAAIPYGLLTVATVLSVSVRSSDGEPILWDLVLAAAAAGWTLWFVTLHRTWWQRTGRMQAFYLGWLVFAGALVVHAPWFGFYTFSGYLYAGLLLHGRWQMGGVVATAVITATSQAGGLPIGDATSFVTYALLIGVNVTLATTFNQYRRKADRQNEDRRRAMGELEATNRRLEQSLAVNAELQEQLLDRAREAGVLAERQRLAGEIHDTLAQDLVGIITQLEALEQERGGETSGVPPELARRVEIAAGLARGALDEARRSVQALRPTPLSDARLPEALAQVAARWSTINGVEASVQTNGPVMPLRPELEVAMLRTAQEALANVARHAGARRVGVTLSYMDDVVTLDVRDDGIGFDPAGVRARTTVAHDTVHSRETIDAHAASPPAEHRGVAPTPSGGFGLVAMRERIRSVAGTLEIESEPGHGTAVSASVPAVPLGAS